MKKATLEELAAHTEKVVRAAEQGERVLITRNGKPLVLITSVGFKDEEDLLLEESPEFWKMIAESRKQPTVPLGEVKAELFGKRGVNGGTARKKARKKPVSK